MFIAICKQLKLVNYTDYSIIHHLHLADSIHSDIMRFIFIATRSFYDEKSTRDVHEIF